MIVLLQWASKTKVPLEKSAMGRVDISLTMSIAPYNRLMGTSIEDAGHDRSERATAGFKSTSIQHKAVLSQ